MLTARIRKFRPRLFVLRAQLSALGLACCALPPVYAGGAPLPQPVKTDHGAVSGVLNARGDVTVFKGIPFAAPPVGELRWKPPVEPSKWAGVLNADHFGARCMQQSRMGPPPRAAGGPGVAGPGSQGRPEGRVGADPQREGGPPQSSGQAQAQVSQSEDCLYLNVWTPAKSAADKLPVMMWIYGGGFGGGAGSDPSFDGEELARKGVVVVTINFRLGIFGFLAMKDLDAESKRGVSGNYGLLDIIDALKWISRNIGAFGGDPKRVTTFGQSSGAGTTQLMSISPLARGLFQRVITESGMFYFSDPEARGEPPTPKKYSDAESQYLGYLKRSGVDSLTQLRAMTAEQINALPSPTSGMTGAFFCPVMDGYVITDTYENIYRQGLESKVPFIVGGTRDEHYPTPYPVTTIAEYQKWAKDKFGSMADEFLKLYPAGSDADVPELTNVVRSEWGRASKFLWAEAYTQASHQAVYTYDWDYPRPDPSNGMRGAGHGSEIPYVFNSLAKIGRPYTPEQVAIAEAMTIYWSNFAASGDPNGKGLPVWPAHSSDARVTMQLGDVNKMIPIMTEPRFEFFKRFFNSLPPVL